MTAASVRLGSGPRGEPTPADVAEALRVCRAYRLAFRMLFGDEPAGARPVVAPSLGDAPFELSCEYDSDDPPAAAYALACSRADIDRWETAGLTAPPRTPSGRGRRGV